MDDEEEQLRRVGLENAQSILHARNRAHEALRKQSEWLRITLASIGDAVISTDVEGLVTYMNRVAEEMTGWLGHEAEGRSISEVFQTIDEHTREPLDNPALRTLRNDHPAETHLSPILVRRDGSTAPIDRRAAPIRDDHGAVVGSLLVFRDISERRRLEQQSQDRLASARMLASIVESSDDAILSKSIDGTIQSWNAAAQRLFGHSAEEAVGRNISLIIPADRADEERDILSRLRRGERIEHFETVRVRSDGQEVHVSITVSPIRNDAGEVIGASKIARDITDRKHAEDRLRESEQRTRLATEATAVGIWEWNVVTGEVNWDAQMFRIYGMCPTPDGKVPYEAWRDAVLEEDLQRQEEVLQDTILRQSQSSREFRIQRADNGEYRNIQSVEAARANAHGQTEWIVGTNLDVTDRRQHETILEAQKGMLELLVSGAALTDVLNAVCEVIEAQGAQGVIATILLLDEEGKHLRSVAGRRAPSEYIQAIDGLPIGPSVGSCGTAAYRGEQVIVTDIESDPLWADFRELAMRFGFRACWSTPIFSSMGKVLGTFAIYCPTPRHPTLHERRLVDILTRTSGIAIDRRRDEEALRESDRRKDEFLAVLAHELRNPLAPIRNGLEVLRLAHIENPSVIQARTMIERQLAQMVHLVDDLMDVSRISRGKLQLRKEHIELATVLDNAVETSRPVIASGGHHLTFIVPHEPIHVHADVTRLGQVFANLLNNAAKYSPLGSEIRITVGRTGDEVTVSVQDAGVGIPSDMLPKIFEMFTQVDRSLEKSQGGLGIGLTLVKRLVEMHEGSVTARSEGHGKGSEFIVRLPVIATARTSITAPDEPLQPSGARTRVRILVADDNVDSAESLKLLLALMGHDVRTVEDGLRAVEVASDFLPEVILLDIGMPKLNGYEACRRIREQPWLRQPMVIALTGWGQEEDRQRSFNAGFDHHLVKPVDPATLGTLLAELPA